MILLIVFLAIGFFGDSSSYFVGNLTPEITGVCLELLVILWVFDKWQENSKRKKLISLERRLREYLIFFLKHNFKTLPKEYRVGRFFGKDHEKNIEQLKKLSLYINDNGLNEKGVISIHEHCVRESSTLDNLLPVASDLTNTHFKAWCRIVYFVNCIAKDKEPVGQSTRDIIQNIIRFDTASYERKLYVGANGNEEHERPTIRRTLLKLITREQIKKDLPKIYFTLLFFSLLTIVWNLYGNKTTAQLEARLGKTIFTKSENDCRIDNLTYLNKESEGNGKVYLLKLYDSNTTVSHLIVCNNKNQIVDKNNLFKKTACDFDKLDINSTTIPVRVKYKKLAELEISENNVTKAILYNNAFHDDFELTVRGIEYTEAFLKTLK